jgi:hypothetical protein
MSKQAILPQTDLPPDLPFERLRAGIERELATLRSKDRLSYENRISAHYAALTPPTGGRFVAGDRVLNKAPAELGGAGSKYVITGWICTVTGDPGTWKEMRVLTGA